MLLSAGGVWLLGQIGMSSTVAKLIVDFLLYFLSYRVQQKWVFAEK
jgi:dolichol-phosphate mannosyltransferase